LEIDFEKLRNADAEERDGEASHSFSSSFEVRVAVCGAESNLSRSREGRDVNSRRF
jgi:hypothetical protein